MNFKILGIDHLGLAPKDPDATRTFFGDVLGLDMLGEENVAEQKVNTIMYASESTDAQDQLSKSSDSNMPRLEILDTLGDREGPVAKFLAKKGSGIHHVALRVDHIENALKYLQSKNVPLVDEVSRNGSHNTKIAFIHPKATGGLLIELVQQV